MNNCTAKVQPMVEGGPQEFVVEGELISDMPRPVVDPSSQVKVFEAMVEVTLGGTIKYRLRAAVGTFPQPTQPEIHSPGIVEAQLQSEAKASVALGEDSPEPKAAKSKGKRK